MSQFVFASRDEWLEARGNSIGGSDIASVMGLGYQTKLDLWKEKTGQKKAPDISDNERIQLGNQAEPVLRELFAVIHPEYEVSYEPFNLCRPDDPKYYFCHYSYDGLLKEKETDREGILEIKTATCMSRADWEKWENRVPQNYFLQCLWGMFVLDREYTDLFAMLKNNEGDLTVRTYHFERADSADYIEEMKQAAREFWTTVERKSVPSITLSL